MTAQGWMIAVLLWVSQGLAVGAELACPPIFSDHMVLQRDQPVAIWGTAEARATVTVEFAGQERVTTADADGHWRLRLEPLPASARARVLTITARHRDSSTQGRQFTDVLVGEVWLCSGQSNMEKPLGPRPGQQPTDNHEVEIHDAQHPRLRLYQVPHHGRPRPGVDGLRWLPCTPEAIVASTFSAAAYHFGRELLDELDVPVGVIHASFGGTMIEAWMPRAAMAEDPALRPLLDQRYPAWVEGVQATELFESMLEPLVPYSIRGFLWYQGEANCMQGDGLAYTAKQRALIGGWREIWNDARAPFYFAQLAPFNYSAQPNFPKSLTPEALPLFWEAQAAALDVPHSGMIVTTDLAGDALDLHPTNKRDVGLRLARLALHDTYGRRDVIARGPEFASLRVQGAEAEITFTHVAGGLHSRDGAPLTHFTIAGADGDFHAAGATIRGPDRIVVSHRDVVQPVAVRFGWHETAMPNLVNRAGLPARPFRTDDWPVEVERSADDRGQRTEQVSPVAGPRPRVGNRQGEMEGPAPSGPSTARRSPSERVRDDG